MLQVIKTGADMDERYTHGWRLCRECHPPGCDVTRSGEWHLRANPGYWGASSPQVLVLGFSKGANQIREAEKGEFDSVAFAGARDRLATILHTLNVRIGMQSLDSALTAGGQHLGVASLIRCGLSLEQHGKLITSGPVMVKAIAGAWTRLVMERCIRRHLSVMPPSVRAVVLLGNGDRYVEGVMSLMQRIFSDFVRINAVAFYANGVRWVFAAHPARGNGHFDTWVSGASEVVQGRKRELAVEALSGIDIPKPPAPTPTPQSSLPTSSKQPMNHEERFATSFYLLHVDGTHLYPVRIRNRDSGQACFRVSQGGAGGNTKTAGREVEDEATLLRLVDSGYMVRAAPRNGGPANLYRVGQRAIRELVRCG